MNAVPLISVIVPCYNQSRFLPDALDSVFRQTIKDWECIIIDDGSSDDTKRVAYEWIERDSRFRYYYKENGGLSSARNYGLSNAMGRYIQFLDADDVILTNKLELQSQQLANSSYSFSFCDYLRGSEENINVQPSPDAHHLPPLLGEVTSVYEMAADWETRLSIPAHCFLFNRTFFDEGILFDESLPNHEDWDCWMQVFHKADEIHYCPQKLAIYRFHSYSMCSDLTKMRDGFLKAINKQLEEKSYSRELRAILRLKRAEIKSIYDVMLMHQKCQDNNWRATILRTFKRLM